MPDRFSREQDRGDESAEARRERQSAREVAEWEAAFHTPKTAPRTEPEPDGDRANAGAMVSRAHRAEKASGGSDQARSDQTED